MFAGGSAMGWRQNPDVESMPTIILSDGFQDIGTNSHNAVERVAATAQGERLCMVCAGLALLGSGKTRLGLEDMRIPPARNEPWCREARTSRRGHTPWLSVQVHTAPKSSMLPF